MRCVVKLSLSAFAVVKTWSCPGKLIHSIIPRVKSSLNFQRFCSLKKKADILSDPLMRKATEHFSHLVSSLSCQVFFFLSTTRGNTEVTRKGGDRCKDRERVVANKQGDVIFSHAQIKCTWKTIETQRIVSPGRSMYLPFWALMHTKTIQWC